MLAAGGKGAAGGFAGVSIAPVFDETLSDRDHLEAVRGAFFAPNSDPAVWRGGWHPATVRMQGVANSATPVDDWWNAGGKVPILVIQGLQDRVALPENGRLLKAEAPDRVELIELDGAGHALLPERPVEIARAVTGFLRKVAGPSR
jgi:pimeloyl-ACP methyl ester carboxylesterase